ncbi:DinB family protein [Zeaxanthinibacter enoshimensis]|uniref:DinB family protein n=1 Tax=Zeaxanthinibacter enoshimensis TaxID=392009 RepID=A0A4R6TM86_9FLAO|nr:DinB family protein [Zeaxanthinibacter enoshimensis]TDQ30948.1 DinB family protein [Zeaxanthinibacter enoshimensis]
MKKISIILFALLLVGFNLSDLKLTDEERAMAVDHLKQTRDNLMASVDGLSDEQLNFKNSPESWSVAECVEHLAISEKMIGEMLKGTLQSPANADMRSEVKMSDADILAMITNRDQKIKTAEAFEPSGQFGDFEQSLEAFKSARKSHIDYMKETEDDLRNHYAQMPFGTIDAYQAVLFMSGHTARHNAQIAEIMESPDFPEE